MRNYPEIFERMDRTVQPHIDPNPRCDLHKVYVFTDNTITEDQLRTDLELKVGVQPKISDVLAINCLLLEEKYNKKGNKIGWRFTEARTHLNTRSILEKYFPELVKKEYFVG